CRGIGRCPDSTEGPPPSTLRSVPLDPRTPVIVGVGQLSNRVDRGEEPLEPVELLARAARRAEADTGASGVLSGLDAVQVVSILSWRYADPGRLVAGLVGAGAVRTTATT